MVKVKDQVAFFETLVQKNDPVKKILPKKEVHKNDTEILEVPTQYTKIKNESLCLGESDDESGYCPDTDEQSKSNDDFITTKLEEMKEKFKTVSQNLDNAKVLEQINELHDILDSILHKQERLYSDEESDENANNRVHVKMITNKIEKIIENNSTKFKHAQNPATVSNEYDCRPKESTNEKEINKMYIETVTEIINKQEDSTQKEQSAINYKNLDHKEDKIKEHISVDSHSEEEEEENNNKIIYDHSDDDNTNGMLIESTKMDKKEEFTNENNKNQSISETNSNSCNFQDELSLQEANMSNVYETIEESKSVFVKDNQQSSNKEEPIYENIEEIRAQLNLIQNKNSSKIPCEISVEAINDSTIAKYKQIQNNFAPDTNTCENILTLNTDNAEANPEKPTEELLTNSLRRMNIKLKKIKSFSSTTKNTKIPVPKKRTKITTVEIKNDTLINNYYLNRGANEEQSNNANEENFGENDTDSNEENYSDENDHESIRDSGGNFRMKSLPQETGEPDSVSNIPQKAHLLVKELLSSEKNFQKVLHIVVEEYMPYIENTVPIKLQKLTPCIFGNIIEIFQHSKLFLKKLESCEYNLDGIADILIESESYLNLYKEYSLNKPKSDVYITNLLPFMKTKQELLGDMNNISSYLISPVQRMGKYLILIENIIKQLKAHSVTTSLIEKFETALLIVRNTMEKSNYSLAINSIKNSPIPLSECGLLLLHGRCEVRINTKKSSEYMVFLFENIIIFTKIVDPNALPGNMELYFFETSIYLSDLSILEEDGHNWFKVWDFSKGGSKNKKLTYVINAIQQKNSIWIKQIRDLLWLQLKNKKVEQQVNVSKPMDK